MVAYCFQEADFAVTDRLPGSEIETQRKSRHRASLADGIRTRIRALGGDRGGTKPNDGKLTLVIFREIYRSTLLRREVRNDDHSREALDDILGCRRRRECSDWRCRRGRTSGRTRHARRMLESINDDTARDGSTSVALAARRSESAARLSPYLLGG
jgi:hypothetical protein